MSTQYQILVRGGSDHLFVAAVLGMPDCSAEGRTREEAISNARAALIERLTGGEIVTIEVKDAEVLSVSGAKSTGNVWRDEAARFREDPTFDEFVTEIQSERRDLDSEGSAS